MSTTLETESTSNDKIENQQRKEKPKKKFDPIDFYLKDTYVDCKDSVNSWCLAKILERCDDDRTLRVNFDGWSHKWDEWVKFTSSKICPFRKYSAGYSGQTKVAIRDWKFSVPEANQKIQKLQEVVASNFTNLASSFEITQYLRGSEYVYVDCLLQFEYKNPKEELPYVFKYLDVFLQAHVKFLNMLPDYYQDYLEGLANLDAFLTNPRIAFVHALHEMSDSLNKIFGSTERLWSEFGAYDSEEYGINLCESDEYAGKDITTRWTADFQKNEDEISQKKKGKKHSELICQLINLFGQHGGFEAWLKAFTYCKEEPTDSVNGPLLPPFKVMMTLLLNLTHTHSYLNKELHIRIMPAVKSAVARRLKYISDKEIKDLDRDILVRFLTRSQNILSYYFQQDEIALMVETAELDLSLKFLTCPYFEKRLRGINEIKELTEKIELHEDFAKDPQQYSSLFSQKMTKKLNARMFIDWINKNKIFELILGDSIHIEIIKRTHEIIKFMAKFEQLPLNLLDLLWNSCSGKHEAITIGLYDLIVEIADILDMQGIVYLKQKINSIPDEEQNELTLKLIKGFALKTLPSSASKALKEGTDEVDESKFHCLDTLWRLMLDESKVSPALSENALNGLIEILKERACQDLKKVYLYKSLEKIKRNESCCQCINLITTLLSTSYKSHSFDTGYSLSDVLADLDDHFNLEELCLTEFENFQRRMRDIFSKSKSDPTEEERQKVYFGKYNYYTNLYNRFVFLRYIATNKDYGIVLNLQHLDRLWELFALNAIWESDREYFFNWISNNRDSSQDSDYYSPIISEDLIPQFFEKILCNHKKLDFINMTPKAFECFQTYFRTVNEIKGNFKKTKGTRFLVYDLAYEGKESLWTIFLNCKNQQTISKVITLLVNCCLKLGPTLEREKKKICEEFTLKCVNLLKEGYLKQNDRLISKSVLLLMNFFDSFEGKGQPEASENTERRRYNINMTCTIVLKPDNVIKNVSINSTQTIRNLRTQIAEAFSYTINEFKIYCKGSLIENDEDDSPLFNYPFGGPYIIYKVQVPKNEDNNFHPKLIMTQNTEYIDLLFKLLSEDVQAVNSVWELLVRLPVNEKIKNTLYEVSDNWDNILEVQSLHLHRLLYCLQIIEDFLLDKEAERLNPVDFTQQNVSPMFKDEEWMQKFYETGGLKTLITILLQPQMTTIKTTISIKSLSIILKIICYYFSKLNFQALFHEKVELLEIEMIQRIIEIINNTGEYSLQHDQSDNETGHQSHIKVYYAGYHEPIQVPENLYHESELISYAQSLLLISAQRNPSLLTQIYKYPKLESMLSIGLIESNNQYLKEKLCHGILSLIIQFQDAGIKPTPHQFLIPILLQNTLQKALIYQDKSERFFRMLTNIVNNISFGELNFDVDNLMMQLVKFIKERTPREKSHKDVDIVLNGILLLMRGLFFRFPEKALKYGQEEKLVLELLQNCLFEIPRRANRRLIPGPKCKNSHSRFAALRLLVELAQGSSENLREIISYISPIHRSANWRTKRWVDWHITQKDNGKSSTGYVGLKNLGCICYMNSTIQQLYMIPTFRKAVIQVEDKSLNTLPKEDNILYQLKSIFVALNESEKQYFNPKGFCHSFKDYDGNPTNVFEQMDADEFFNMFMDKLENQIKGTPQEQFIKQHFGGVVSNELICKGCPHYSEREETFLTVSLEVKNKKNIDQSLAAFAEGEMLEGDNAYHCALCDKKVSALKRACLKKLPNHLIMVLKRFEFDYDTGSKVKVNDFLEFPNKLNIEPYTQQGMRKAEKAKKNGNEESQDKDQKEEEAHEYPPSYFEYKLTGVVIHLGFADSGHYYSLIQDHELTDIPEDKRWYEFNDHLVSNFDPKNIPSVAFGGEEKWKYYNVGEHSSTEKIKNAYLLFYERIEHFNEEQTAPKKQESASKATKEEDAKEAGDESQTLNTTQATYETQIVDERPPVVRKLTSDSTVDSVKRDEDSLEDLKNVPQEFLKELMEKNQKFHTHRNIFSQEYFDFVEEIITKRQYAPNLNFQRITSLEDAASPDQFYDFETLKLGILFLLTAIVRDKSRNCIIKNLPFLKHQLKLNVPACVWLLEMFAAKKLKFEFFLDCPVLDMQRFAIGLITSAYRTVFEYEGKGPRNRFFDVDEDTQLPKTVLGNFTNSCINLIFEAKENNRDYTEFFRLFCEMISCGHEVAEYLISKKVIGRLMDFFFEDASPLNSFFRDMSDVPYNEPTNLELGQPQEEKKKIRSAWEEFMLKRKDKQISENHAAQKSYVWKTVNMLIRYCKVSQNPKRCQLQIGDFDCELLSNELTLLTPSATFVGRVIFDAQTKIGYRNVAELYAYLSYEDPKFTGHFIKAIQSGLSDVENSAIKSFMRCFIIALTIEDSLTQLRCNELCGTLLKEMEDNTNFFFEMETYTSFFIKVMEKVENARNWFITNQKKWEWVIQWLVDHPVPPLGMFQGKTKTNRRRMMMGMSNFKQDSRECKAKTTLKINKLKSLLQGQTELNNIWDSDDDLAEHQWKTGEKVDFCPNSGEKWITAEVENILEEMVSLTWIAYDGDNIIHWIGKDCDSVATYKGIQSRQDAVDELMEKVDSNKNVDEENNERSPLGYMSNGDDSFKNEEGTENSSDSMSSITAI